ncbi:Calcitonin gene-related peptide type 1 receptor [Nymphon striatum]|nr:Calcitonin gene-related peptide type 1 receptor [Nymphon striatum]
MPLHVHTSNLYSFGSTSQYHMTIYKIAPQLVTRDNLHLNNVTVKMAAAVISKLEAKSEECQIEFDGWGCWPKTQGSQISRIPCPELSNFNSAPQKGYASRHCKSSAEWEDANYTNCTQNSQKILTDEYKTKDVRQAYKRCLIEVLLQPTINAEGSGACPRMFDGWGCWNDTPAASTAFIQCPDFVFGFNEHQLAYKICQPSGEWFRHPETNTTWSNYTTCVDEADLKNTRINIHKNLFISFIVNNTIWIIWYAEVVKKPEVIIENQIGCQILHVIVQYFMVCNYLWMFCEGFFLFSILVSAFLTEEKLMIWIYAIGWGAPAVLTTIYAVVRATNSPSERTQSKSLDIRDFIQALLANAHFSSCWINESPFLWILSGPVCVSMLLNLAFLIKIVNVLVNKLRAGNSVDNYQTRKAVRATLILIPLLGLHYILIPFRPETKSPGEAVYETVSAVVTSLQLRREGQNREIGPLISIDLIGEGRTGLCVSFLFCFTNAEIYYLLKKTLDEILLRREVEKERTMKIRQSDVYEDRHVPPKQKNQQIFYDDPVRQHPGFCHVTCIATVCLETKELGRYGFDRVVSVKHL